MISSLSAHWHYFWLVIASFIAGVMNAMAGGGSFISFPVMLSIGIAPIQANATNTVALWPGQLTSVAALRAVVTFVLSGAVIWHYCLTSMVFAGVGGYVGAQYARRMNADVLRTIVVITGCLMAAYFFWRIG